MERDTMSHENNDEDVDWKALMAGGWDNDDDDDDDDDDGNNIDFVTTEQLEEEQAQKRRLARKRRLEQVMVKQEQQQQKQHDTAENGPFVPIHISSSTTTASVTERRSTVFDTNLNAAAATATATAEENEILPQDDNDDNFDMFNTSVSPPRVTKNAANDNGRSQSSQKDQYRSVSDIQHHKDDVDDAEGYYKASIGEIMTLDVPEDDTTTTTLNEGANDSSKKIQLRVLGIIGKGVFSSVLKCSSDAATSNDNLICGLPSEVAVKCIRSNETMAKAALNEMKYLIQLRHAPGIVPLLLPRIISINANNNNPSSYPTTTPIRPPLPIEFKGHTLLIFPYEPYNLRDVLLKFGRGVGLSLTAVKSYFGQLLAAATHLQKHKILHADIKPDNILVSGDFSKVMICDFGSAMDASDGAEGIITPYLVSRFYRAPEIILGLPVSYSIDLWSLAVTAAELFLGKVLFHGTTNNDMLHMMMDTMGPFSTRMIRSHVLQTQKHPLPAHFLQQQSNYVFRQETIGALFSVQRRKWTLFI
jgi:serine/threonine-protein kinase PRP4